MGYAQKAAFITGAASGIGEGIAKALDADGFRIVVADIAEAAGEEVASHLRGGLYIHTDVSSAESVRRAAELTLKEVGSVDVLVNCAGTDKVKPFLEGDEELWSFLVELNLIGVFRVTKAFLPQMVDRRYGRIVNIASDVGRVGNAGQAVYSGCKGGMIAFTKTIAREGARHGITANSVCPGPTDTPPFREVVASSGEDLIEQLSRAVPLGRIGQPDDVAAAVSFFASEGAGFVTGQTLSVSGGMSMC